MDKQPWILSFTNRLLQKFCKPSIVEGILGDLEESYYEQLESHGKLKTNMIHLIQALGFLRPRFRKKDEHSTFEAMLKNYTTSTLRNLRKHKFYTFINVFGLVLGMTAGFMILQYVYYELNYDDFLANKENIYRIQTNRYNNGELTTQWAAGCAGVGLHMKEDLPEVKDFVILHSSGAQISYNEKYFPLDNPYYAGANFFQFFSIPLLQGVDSLVLRDPWSVVLSESLAERIFGEENPIGKRIRQNDNTDFTVTGVFEDLPERSHMAFDLLYSFESYVLFTSPQARTDWQWDGFLNYVSLYPGTDPKEFSEKLPDWIISREGEALEQYNAGMDFVLQPLTKIHLTSNYIAEIKTTGNEKTTHFLLIIGMFVLFIAWINYINLTTARALNRAKEVGVRKVLGSQRSQLIFQFMFESLVLNLLALFIAVLLVILVFPAFNDFVGRTVPYTWPDAPFFWWGLSSLFILGFILSGFYPAFVLSGFKPIRVLKGRFSGSVGGNNLRRGLVTFQFLASVILITGTYVVYKQMNFLQSQDLGVEISQKMIVSTPVFGSDSVSNMKDAYFKNLLSSSSSVQAQTISTEVPGRKVGWNAGGVRLINQTEAESNQYRLIGCDDQYLEFYGIELLVGRTFDRSFGTEEDNVVFTEAAVAVMGFSQPSEAINQKIYIWGDTLNVIGVVRDFRQESPAKAYDPLIFRYFDSPNGYYSLEINTNNMQASVADVQANWEAAFGNKIFDFFFLDDHYNEQYRSEIKFGSIFGLFAVLAILVACLGLFGLASYITNLRAKEVGVRKVLGASLNQLLRLLTWDFVKLVVLSIAIAAPISWWFLNSWLQDFENRIGVGFDLFIIPAMVTLCIALFTVSWHTLRTAKLNPADTLHDE
ncbi:MAG: ABC transporter permease [Bacteroidota bacterium]